MDSRPTSLLDRLAGACFTLLLAVGTLYVAVRLIESVAAALVIIAAVAGGLIITSFLVRVLWQRSRGNRW